MGPVNLVKFDPINRMIPLTVIPLSGAHCIIKIFSYCYHSVSSCDQLWFAQKKVWGSRHSRPIKIKVEMSRSVKVNFWNLPRMSLLSRQQYFLSRSRFLKSRFGQVEILVNTVEIVETNQDFRELFSFVKIYRDTLTFLRGFRLKNIEIWIKKNAKINSLLIEIETNCQDLPKISGLNRFLDLDWDLRDCKVVLK
jgi:hypothetical protein